MSDYKEKKLLRNGVEVVNRSLWYSKSELQQAINVIRVQATNPCQDEQEIAAHPHQGFHFSEMAKSVKKCYNKDLSYQLLPAPAELQLNEYDF